MSGYEDRAFTKRLVLALAASVAVHEVVAGLWPRTQAPAAQERVAMQVMHVTRRTPPPTPRPKPPPTPVPTTRPTPAPHYTLAPRIAVRAPAAKAAAEPRKTAGGAAAPLHVVRQIQHAPHSTARPVSLAAGTHAGRQNGGSGLGAGAGAGTGGLAGTSTGSGSAGNGNGGDANTAPCGSIYILPGALSFRSDGTAVQQVLAKVILRDGDVEVAKFPYPFIYARDAQNPFEHDSALSKDGGIPVQPPPPGADLASMPEPVQIVLKHTNPTTGFTDLRECTPPAAS